jgi:hypothetical protein
MSKAGELKYPTGRKGEPRTVTAPRFNNAQFVQLELTEEQSKELKATIVTGDGILEQMEKMIDDGYKFTIKYDSYGDCIGAWCQPTDEGSANSGYILTGRGTSASKAVKQLLYKHHVLLQGDWGTHARPAHRVNLDD